MACKKGRLLPVVWLFSLFLYVLCRIPEINANNHKASTKSCELSAPQGNYTTTINTGDVFIQWQVTGSYIEVMLQVDSDIHINWIAFGLSEVGHMLGSDIVSFYNKFSGTVVVDRYVPWASYPLDQNPSLYPQMDIFNNWNLVCSDSHIRAGDDVYEEASDIDDVYYEKFERQVYLKAILRRPLNTGDPQDRPFIPGPMPTIFAWGYDGQSSISYHGASRGSADITFIREEIMSVEADALGDVDATESVYYDPPFVLDGPETQYICQSFDLGEEVRHVAAIEPQYVNSQAAGNVHHMLVHFCEQESDVFIMHEGSPSPCGNRDDMVAEGRSLLGNPSCSTLMYAWAVGGGQKLVLPAEAGILIGGDGSTGGGSMRYIIIETHLSNPLGVSGLRADYVGIKLSTTSVLRKHDASSFAIGDPTLSFSTIGNIPAGQEAVHYEATCSSSCTKQMTGPINVYASFLHMHQYGRQIWTTKTEPSNYYVSNAESKFSLVDSRQFWNFGYQTIQPTSFTIQPGDRLNVHCIFDTSLVEDDVSFGLATYQEMCMQFLYYYPASNTRIHMCGYMGGGNSLCARSLEEGENSFTDAVLCDQNPDSDGTTEIPEWYEFAMTGSEGNATLSSSRRQIPESTPQPEYRISGVASTMTKRSLRDVRIGEAYCEYEKLKNSEYLYYYIGLVIVLACCIIPALVGWFLKVCNSTYMDKRPSSQHYEMVSVTSNHDSEDGIEIDGNEGKESTFPQSNETTIRAGTAGTRGRESTGYISRVDHRRATPATTDRGGTLDDFALPTDSDFDKNSSVGSPMRAADDV